MRCKTRMESETFPMEYTNSPFDKAIESIDLLWPNGLYLTVLDNPPDSDQILLLHEWRTLRKKSSETTVCYATFLYTSGENNGSVDITHCVVEIDLSVFSSSNLFVCIRCYKRLLRFEKAKTNLRSFQEETKEDFKKGADRTKRLRRNSAEKDGDIENIFLLIRTPSLTSAATICSEITESWTIPYYFYFF